MEIIEKNANFLDAVCRFPSLMPTIEHEEGGESAYGCYPLDIVISSNDILYDLKKTLPLSENFLIKNETGEYIFEKKNNEAALKYRILINRYNWLKNYNKNCHFYQICNMRGEIKLLSRKFNGWFFNFNGEGYASVEEVDGNVGDFIYVNEEYKEFCQIFTDNEHAAAFTEIYNRIVTGNTFDDMNFTQPFFTLNLCLTEEYDDEGILSPYNALWMENKKYHLHDVVIAQEDDNVAKAYELVKGGGEEGNYLYDKIKAVEEVREFILKEIEEGETIVDGKTVIYDEMGVEPQNNYILLDGQDVYFIYPYYKGEYDTETRETYFDDDEKTHWREIESAVTETDSVTGVTESRLSTLRRSKSTFIDAEGKKWDFILNGNICELPYLHNVPMNPEKENGVFYASVLTEVDVDGTKIEPQEDNKIVPNNIPSTNGRIKFIYQIGAKYNLNKENTLIFIDSGITYEEEYLFEKKEIEVIPKGESTAITLTFIDVSYGDIVSSIKYGNSEDYSLNGISWYKDETIMGVVDAKIDANIKIERGKTAAIERFNILGEVRSLKELENYRNDFFGLRNK